MSTLETFVADCEAAIARRVTAPVAARGWPVGTLVHNRRNGRRGTVAMSCGDACSIQFNDRLGNYWVTTWDVVLRNYTRA